MTVIRAASAPRSAPEPLGLTTAEALLRLAQYGPNDLVPASASPGPFTWLRRVLTDPMVILLLVAGAVYLIVGDFGDAAASLIALVAISAVSVVLERRTERALQSLQRLTSPTALAWRDGRLATIAANGIVPGDRIVLREGDVVPADATVIAEGRLIVDESSLTGESDPVDLERDAVARAGTTVLSGRADAIVVETGPRTRYGRIGALVAGIAEPPTPLQRGIRRFVTAVGIVALLASAGVTAVELVHGVSWTAAIVAGISLAMAAIPEEFPMVFALYLALGAWRLARHRALIRRLAKVETLGATTVIATDKTGTLTAGRLELRLFVQADGSVATGIDRARLLEAAIRASEPSGHDPLDAAILRDAAETPPPGELVASYPFDPRAKSAVQVWRRDGRLEAFAKGALEPMLDRTGASSAQRTAAEAANARLAASGMRVLALASGPASTAASRADAESALTFRGLVAFADPIRDGVREALDECRSAGIRVVMITGDHPATAQAVARDLGLPGAGHVLTGEQLHRLSGDERAKAVEGVTVFARIEAAQKYELVRALHARGAVVAMTGDGTNDAPALREADIGIAMGRRGTEVARAAATMILLDDNFATIVHSIRDGRRIFENLRRAFAYLIAFHVPLLLAAVSIPLVGAPLLLLPIHLVWLEIVVHPTSSLVFEADAPAADIMRRPPRASAAQLIALSDLRRPVVLGITLTVAVLALYLGDLARGCAVEHARALALTALLCGQLLLVLVTRSPARAFWRASVAGNRALPLVVGGAAVSLVAALQVPLLARFFEVAPLDPLEWAAALGVAVVATLWSEPFKGWSPSISLGVPTPTA